MNKPTPIENELLVMAALWWAGQPMTAREIHEWMKTRGRGVAKPTDWKLIRMMCKKGLLHKLSSTPARYEPTRTREDVRTQLVVALGTGPLFWDWNLFQAWVKEQ